MITACRPVERVAALVEHVAKHLGGHHDDRRLAVDRVVAGQQPHAFGAVLRRRGRRTSGSTALSAASCRTSCDPPPAPARSRTPPRPSCPIRSARRPAPTGPASSASIARAGTRRAGTGTAAAKASGDVTLSQSTGRPRLLRTPRRQQVRAAASLEMPAEQCGELLGPFDVREVAGPGDHRELGARDRVGHRRRHLHRDQLVAVRRDDERRDVDRRKVRPGVGSLGHPERRRRDRLGRLVRDPARGSSSAVSSGASGVGRGGGESASTFPSRRSRSASATRAARASAASGSDRVFASTRPAIRERAVAPELEGDVPADREAAHHRSVDAGGIERLDAAPGRLPHRHHAVGGGSGAPEPRQARARPSSVRRAVATTSERRAGTHGSGASRSSHRLRVRADEHGQRGRDHLESAGSDPTRSPSAYTCTRRSASIFT